jgi:hypothetical protein
MFQSHFTLITYTVETESYHNLELISKSWFGTYEFVPTSFNIASDNLLLGPLMILKSFQSPNGARRALIFFNPKVHYSGALTNAQNLNQP